MSEDLRKLKVIIAVRLPIGIAVLLGALLAAAGTIGYWQAWVVCATLLLVPLTVGIYFLRTDPEFLIHRLQFREKEPAQKRLIGFTSLAFFAAMLLPGFDLRLGWSAVPPWVCLFALALFLAAYAFVFWVFKTNRYASRIVEVQPGQKVIDSGPYAVVRHPMYAAQLVMFPAFLLALGSWWAALLGAAIVFPLVLRIKNEEAVLRRDLPGYQAYCEKTRYRLIPHLWSLLLLALTALPLAAQQRGLSKADSALVARLLEAEDRRDSTAAAWAEGLVHPDARVQLIARRGLARVRDPQFSARDSLPPLPAPRHWAEPAWRLRYRALAKQGDDCAAMRAGLADGAWHVRLRAADLVGAGCASDDSIGSTLRAWADDPTGRGASHGGSWHPAAHALVALARLLPDDARPRVARAGASGNLWLRGYAARAAAVLSDTALLRRLAADADDNVKELAIEGLSQLIGHAGDDVYLAALNAPGVQAVRAAALALKGSPRPDVADSAREAYRRIRLGGVETARDARVALLEAAGRPASEDDPPPSDLTLPAEAVALALGADIRLRVNLAGGGSFVVRLRGDVAPITAARVLALVRKGYYDGLIWQRVEPDFVIQGGGPGANEYVGYRHFLRDELGTVPHLRGTVGMSTRGHDTGDAQWFVNLKDNLRLGRDYTLFGEVTEGMEVVDGILEGEVMTGVTVLPRAPAWGREGASSFTGPGRPAAGHLAQG